MKFLGVLAILVAVASCSPVSQDGSVYRSFARNFLDCSNNDFGLCLKEQALKVTDRLRASRKVSIFDGVSILNSSPRAAKSLDFLPSDPEERSKLVTERLWDATADLLSKSELEVTYGGDDDSTESRALGETEEGRGKKDKEKKKKIKMLIPFLLLAKAKAIVLITLSFLVIAASLAKLALFAKIAFIFKAFLAIKALLAKKLSLHEEHFAPVPHIDELHGHGWEGGWARTQKEGNNLAYSAYRK